MKRLFSLFGGIILVICLVTTLPAFDKVPGKFKEFTAENEYVNLEGSICQIVVIGIAEGLYPTYVKGKTVLRRGRGIYAQQGSTFHIGDGYFVTAAHVVNPRVVEIQESLYVTYEVPVDRVVSRMITVGNRQLGATDATLVWEDRDKDLALIHVTNWAVLTDLGYKLEFTVSWIPLGWGGVIVDDLVEGVALATIVTKRVDPSQGDLTRLPWYEVRYGKVIDSHVKLPEDVPTNQIAWFSLNDVTMDIDIFPGDSGSPVFAFKNGVPVIIGVVRACIIGRSVKDGGVVIEKYSYFARIDSIARKRLEGVEQ